MLYNKLGEFIKIQKDRKTLMDNNAIYPVKNIIVQTKRKLKTRLNEYIKNIRLDLQKHSVILDIFKHDYSMDWENIKILDFESKYQKINFRNDTYQRRTKKSQFK